MTTDDKEKIIKLQNYYVALAENSHELSRREGLSQYSAGFSSGRCSAFMKVVEHLRKLIEEGEVEV